MKRRLKPVLLLVFGAALAWPQSSTTTSGTDLNGYRTQGRSFDTSANGDRTERFQSINGRQVPVEQVTERVVSEDANGKVTERIVKKFDPSGQPASTERVMIEENKLPGGGSTVQETTYRNDLNGSLREAERKTTETTRIRLDHDDQHRDRPAQHDRFFRNGGEAVGGYRWSGRQSAHHRIRLQPRRLGRLSGNGAHGEDRFQAGRHDQGNHGHL